MAPTLLCHREPGWQKLSKATQSTRTSQMAPADVAELLASRKARGLAEGQGREPRWLGNRRRDVTSIQSRTCTLKCKKNVHLVSLGYLCCSFAVPEAPTLAEKCATEAGGECWLCHGASSWPAAGAHGEGATQLRAEGCGALKNQRSAFVHLLQYCLPLLQRSKSKKR